MMIAGELSGDELAAQWIRSAQAERRMMELPALDVFGAGGPQMAAAGADLSLDLTEHSVIGLWEVIERYRTFRRIFDDLLAMAVARRPDVFIGVDYGGFNLRFAKALRKKSRQFPDWNLRIVQFVSPQVWASRPGRARRMQACQDLLLSILPFEPRWFAREAPNLPVAFIGHPLIDRLSSAQNRMGVFDSPKATAPPHVVLLPGSRRGEVERHLPVLLETLELLTPQFPTLRATLVLPRTDLEVWARPQLDLHRGLPIHVQIGGLEHVLPSATLALASTGTVTLECAWYRVPTLTLYRTSWLTYLIGRSLITVPHLAMPNLLAGRTILPEFIQHEARPDLLAIYAAHWLKSVEEREQVRKDLDGIVKQLGEPGAAQRAAKAVLALLNSEQQKSAG